MVPLGICSNWLESTRNPLGIRLEFSRNGIWVDPSDLVGIWSEYSESEWNLGGLSLTCHSYHSYHSARNLVGFHSDPLGMCGGVSSTHIAHSFILQQSSKRTLATLSQGTLNHNKYPVLTQIFLSSAKKEPKKAWLSINDTDSSVGNDMGTDENW